MQHKVTLLTFIIFGQLQQNIQFKSEKSEKDRSEYRIFCS